MTTLETFLTQCSATLTEKSLAPISYDLFTPSNQKVTVTVLPHHRFRVEYASGRVMFYRDATQVHTEPQLDTQRHLTLPVFLRFV
jgi:hypothetical protein